MVRPRHEHPTPAELEVLQVLWQHGPSSVREVMDALNPSRPRAYTSVMSLLNVMADKDLVRRKPKGRAFIYSARSGREKTLGGMLGDLMRRAFSGSASALVCHLLQETKLSEEELERIRQTISTHGRNE